MLLLLLSVALAEPPAETPPAQTPAEDDVPVDTTPPKVEGEEVQVSFAGLPGMRVLVDDVERPLPFNGTVKTGTLNVKVFNPSTKIWEPKDVTIEATTKLVNLNELYPHLVK